jgi:hypothetical protein
MTGLMTGLTMTNERLMTYDDLAAALGIAPDSARRLVARKKWARRPGNDGKARISVPADVIPVIPPDVTPVIPPDVTPDALQVLTRHIERLEAELDPLGTRRDGVGHRVANTSGHGDLREVARALFEQHGAQGFLQMRPSPRRASVASGPQEPAS